MKTLSPTSTTLHPYHLNACACFLFLSCSAIMLEHARSPLCTVEGRQLVETAALLAEAACLTVQRHLHIVGLIMGKRCDAIDECIQVERQTAVDHSGSHLLVKSRAAVPGVAGA